MDLRTSPETFLQRSLSCFALKLRCKSGLVNDSEAVYNNSEASKALGHSMFDRFLKNKRCSLNKFSIRIAPRIVET
jgi:hypothetical protein